jgi:hypothetical protein
MKLRSPEDRMSFLLDIGRIDLLESVDTDEDMPPELFEVFIKRRRGLIRNLVNFRRKQLSRQQWRSGRWKFLRGIRKFHTSVQGKRMHRALGRFLATRIFRPHLKDLHKRYESLEPVQFSALKALSSYRTHMYIEGDYWQPLEEEADLFSLLEYAIPLLNEIELKLYKDSEAELNEDEFELLLRLVDDKELCKSIAEVIGVDPDSVIETHKAVCSKLLRSGFSKDDTYFLTEVINKVLPSVVRNMDSNGVNEHSI